MSDVLIHQQSFDYALSRTVSTLIDWFPAGPLAPQQHNTNNNITAPSAPLIPSSKVPALENPPPRSGGPRRSSSSMELPLAPKMGTVTPRGTSSSSGQGPTGSPTTTRPNHTSNNYVRGMSGSGTPPIGGSFCGGEGSNMSFQGSDTAVNSGDGVIPPSNASGGGGGGWGSYFKWGGRGGKVSSSEVGNGTPPSSAFNPPPPAPLLPSIHFHSLISSLATATIYDSTSNPSSRDSSNEPSSKITQPPPSRLFNNGGFVVRAGVFTGLRLYASDSRGGAIKMFSSLINRCTGSSGGGGGVSPLDIGAAPVIQLRASIRSKDSVNAAGIRLTLQDSGFSSLDFLVTAGRPRREHSSSSNTNNNITRPIPFYTHLCRFDKFLVTNYGMFNLYEASSTSNNKGSSTTSTNNGEAITAPPPKPPILRRLRAGFGLVVRTEKNGLNILWGFCAELFKSLIVAFHADVIRRWCISCCSANTLGIKGLEVGLRLRINLISYQNTMLDVGIKQCIPLVIPSNCRRSNKSKGSTSNNNNNSSLSSPSSSTSSSSLYRLGSWNWRVACNSYGVAVGGSLDDTDVADLIRAVADIVGGGDEGSRTLSGLGTSLVRPVPHRLRRSVKAAIKPVALHLSLPEEGSRLRKVIDGTCHAAGLGYYIGVAVPLYCTAITTALSISGGAALYRQLATRTGVVVDPNAALSTTSIHGDDDISEFPSLGAKLSSRPMAFWEVRRAVGEAVREANWVAILEGSRVDVTCGVTTRLCLPSIIEYVGLTAPDLSNGLVNYFNNYSVGGGGGSSSSVASSPAGGGTRAPSKPPLSPRTATHNQQQGGGGNAASASQNRPAIRGLNCFIAITFS